jgi:hypothetical protein
MKHYIQRQEKDVLPSLVAPPVFVFFWILLGLLLIAGCVACWGEVPMYVAGSGILLSSPPGQNETTALVFLPAPPLLKLRAGLPIQLRIGATGTQGIGQIEKIEPGSISPLDARKRYALDGSAGQIITQPSIVLIARVGPPLSAHLYAGSVVSAQVQSGSRRVLSLLTDLFGSLGGQ